MAADLKAVCAWCQAVLTDGSGPVTHGICSSCAEEQVRRGGVDLAWFLESLPLPVAVVDAAGTVLSANSALRGRLPHPESAQAGVPCGDFFGCRHSSLPRGCGNTMYCPECSLRRLIVRTHQTGQASERVPVVLHGRSGGDIELVVSAQKSGDAVLLRIDE
jgi:hypothetical protein